MSDPSTIDELLDELLDSGRTPEEVCAEVPELLPEVRRRWQRICDLRGELDAWLPPSNDGAPAPPGRTDRLPCVPGYAVEAVVGRGGMGIVFRARHLRLNRPVALKMALAGAYAGPRERERFVREAAAAAKLRHPNIVAVYDVGEAEGQTYYTMEYVEGGTLAESLGGAPQPARQACALVAALARAVAEAHRVGVVHRDLKPANVLITPDGTPKISDFGLARLLDDAAGLTQSGAALGTPNYMAPEQTRAAAAPAGPAADVYALGAILYELLTGRPPFRGRTAGETVHLVVNAEPTPPARVIVTVPRDVETICLVCLQKEPHRRYGGAALLADDLERFLRGEAIAARPDGRLERLARRVRRRPAFSATVGVVVLLAVVGLSGAWWLVADRAAAERGRVAERAAAERAAADDLAEMRTLLQKSRWGEARAVLDRVQVRLANGGLTEHQGLAAQGAGDLDLVARLDAIRLNRSESQGGVMAYERAAAAYEAAFRGAGLGGPGEPAEAVADRVRESFVRTALVAALDDWAILPAPVERRNWLLDVAGRAEPDPTAWQSAARDPTTREDRKALAELLEAARVDQESVPLMLALAEALHARGGDPVPFLTRVRHAHPGDFWVNHGLGRMLDLAGRCEDALRYLQVAQALRPDAAVVYHNLGIALSRCARPGEAVEQYRTAMRLDPACFPSYYNAAIALSAKGDHHEAIAMAEMGLKFAPDTAILRSAYGDSLQAIGRKTEALTQYQRVVELDPRLSGTQRSLRALLFASGRTTDARVAWAKAIAADPPTHDEWDGYAELCLLLGDEDEYLRVRKVLVERFGATTDPCVAERVGRTYLLRPVPDADQLKRAVALIDRALTQSQPPGPVWARPYFLFAKGLGEYRAGRLDAATAALTGDGGKVLGPAPGFVLAMVQRRRGKTELAQKTLAAAVRSFDWAAAPADNRETWIYQILRREAEQLVLGR
ncbi:serine/threonine-protein kinase [Gemmata sp. JC673]|uniref:Serine/threonine-protein kinase n=1 Tax=Gemmata algarum TaxID=2975278 RepID=A0ABU5ES74_9BACT|nr:serine/threonine-protein kinase [Gemmata algarum]MDY3558202.1 serine/threonine-protein kinase [Gemmata algarum]